MKAAKSTVRSIKDSTRTTEGPTVPQCHKEDQVNILAMHMVYGQTSPASSRAFWQGALRTDSPYHGRLWQDAVSMSFSSHNILLAAALNSEEENKIKFTHLVIMHNDIVPSNGWLDVLMEEMARTNCDLLGAVTPIKDLNGLSSTAIDSDDDPFLVHRRLTMTEIHRLPETFDAADCGYPDRRLLVNTGCVLLNFTRAWHNLTNEDGTLALNFASSDRVGRNSDGKWQAQHSPSDWFISRIVSQLGGKVMATRKVTLRHIGELPYTNDAPWGEWQTDKALSHKHNDVHVGNEQMTSGVCIEVE